MCRLNLSAHFIIMKKNQIVQIEIIDITNEGNGVGKYEGMAVFIPETAIGDIIEAKIVKVLKNFCYGIVNKIIKPSSDRIVSDCPYFPKCGGCSFRHIKYEAELKIKEKIVYDAFTRLGHINCEFEPILGCRNMDKYRNKAQYPVSESADGKIICGFYAKRSHRIISENMCMLLPDELCNISQYIIDYCNNYNIPAYNESTGKGVLRHIYLRIAPTTNEIMVCLVTTKKYDFDTLCNELLKYFDKIKSIVLNINSDNTNVILGDKTYVLRGNNKITDILCGNYISIAPESFYQINSQQTENLYSIAMNYAQPDKNQTLLDLYCGAGTIGLSMAKYFKKVFGVEIIPQAIENAKENALNNNIENAEFICADAAVSLPDNIKAPDIVIMDPPRKGCNKSTLDSVIKINPQKIIMISCNPATAARDCSYLAEYKYSPIRVKPVDMFPRTNHVECVVLLTRNNR